MHHRVFSTYVYFSLGKTNKLSIYLSIYLSISNIGKFSCQTVWQSWRNSTIVYDRHYQGLNYFVEISKWAVPSWTLYTLTSVCKFTLSSLYTSYSTYKENLSNNQGLFEYAIISYIVKTLMFDSWVVPWGEIGWN